MKLFKDYTQDFEKLGQDMEAIRLKTHEEHEDTLTAIKFLIDGLTEIKTKQQLIESEIDGIKELIKTQSETLSTVSVAPIVANTEEPVLPSKKGGHISTYHHFDNYKTPREYDMKQQAFLSLKGNQPLNLNFEQLVAIIKAYKNGLPIKKMKVTPILANYTSFAIQNYIYIWRAGGFNQAIVDHARKFGYNPNNLISMEVKENV